MENQVENTDPSLDRDTQRQLEVEIESIEDKSIKLATPHKISGSKLTEEKPESEDFYDSFQLQIELQMQNLQKIEA